MNEENQVYFVDSDTLPPEALARKHRLEQDPSFRTNHMEYMPGMEIIDSDIKDKVLALMDDYDPSLYTAKEVMRALSKESCSIEDFKALLSPAAAPFLEQMARKAELLTKNHFGNTVYIFTPIYIANYCQNYCIYCGFNCYNKIRRKKLTFEEIEHEMKVIAETGMEEILILTGESRKYSDIEYIGEAVKIARKYFRNIELDPEANVGIIELNESGDRYRIVWGLKNGAKPTSELPTHLANLQVIKARNPELRVVYHCHPVNVIALTYVLPLDSRVFTREIYEMATECPIVFPEGIGIVPWMLCGGKLIGDATSEIMKTQDVAIWAHHGAFCCGQDFDLTFGLMHTVEKAAEVLVKVMSMSSYKLNTITPEMFRELNAPFGVHINEKFLYEKKDGKIGQIPEV